MARNLHALLEQAAQLRSGGASWEAVGRRVSRRASTCRNWPKRHAHTWEPLFDQAKRARSDELGNEAESTLRALLRDEDKKWQVKSAEVLMRHRWRPTVALALSAAPSEPGQEPADDSFDDPAQLEAYFHNMIYEMNEWRDDRNLPPLATVGEFQEHVKEYWTFWNETIADPERHKAYSARRCRRHLEKKAIRLAERGERVQRSEIHQYPDWVDPPLKTFVPTAPGAPSLGMLALVGMAALALGITLGKSTASSEMVEKRPIGYAGAEGRLLRQLVLEVRLGEQNDLQELRGLGLFVRHRLQGVEIGGVDRLGLVDQQDDGATGLVLFDQEPAKRDLQVQQVAHRGEAERREDEPEKRGGRPGDGSVMCEAMKRSGSDRQRLMARWWFAPR
jgi:hypothetical protein